METKRDSGGWRTIAAFVGAFLLVAVLPATTNALTTLFYLNPPGWDNSAPSIAVNLGIYLAPVVLLTASALAFYSVAASSKRWLYHALIPVAVLIVYLIASHAVFATICTRPFGYPCT